MKYKNYRNSYTNEDKIYSRKNIADMSVREAFSRKDEIMAQHNSIGIPSEGELKSSPNVIWVESYTRDDGTEVRGHWRSKPDGIANNNFSNGNPTGGASNIDESKQIEQENTINDEEFDYNVLDDLILSEIDNYIDNVVEDTSNVEDNNEENAQILEGHVTKTENPNQLQQEVRNVDRKKDNQTDSPNKTKQQNQEETFVLDGSVSKQDLLNRIKEFAHYNIKPYRDYENLTPVEKGQKWLSKHTTWHTGAEYYGISTMLADEKEPLERFKKNNSFCKLGDIKNERVKALITNKVVKARKDCPVGPSINSPLEDVDVVIPKDNAPIVKEVLESSELGDFIKENYDKLKAGKIVNGSIEFARPGLNMDLIKHPIKSNENIDRFAALHYVDIVDAKMGADGTVTMKLVDYYDFSKLQEDGELSSDGTKVKLSWLSNKFNKANNRAYKQQMEGKLKPYAIYKELKFKL